MVPAALALLTTIFSGRALAVAFGVWGAVSGGAGAVGSEWVFFINVPVTIVGAAAAPAVLPEAKLPRTSYDVAGGLAVTAALTLSVCALVETESNAWGSPATLAPIAGALCLVAVFIAIEARVRRPLVRLGLLPQPTGRVRQCRGRAVRRVGAGAAVLLQHAVPPAGSRPPAAGGRARVSAHGAGVALRRRDRVAGDVPHLGRQLRARRAGTLRAARLRSGDRRADRRRDRPVRSQEAVSPPG